MQTLKTPVVSILTAVALLTLIPADLLGNCRWVTAPTPAVFPSYSVFATTAIDTTVTMEVRCTPHSTGTLTLSASSISGGFSPRQMGLGAERIDYNAYIDAAGTQVFGDGSSEGTLSFEIEADPKGKQFMVTVYLRAFPGADVVAGNYSDVLTAELQPIQGDTPTRSFTVSTEVLAECRASSFNMNFGTYDPLGAEATTPLDAQTMLAVYCTKGVTGTVSMGAGSNAAGSTRRMASGGNFLIYDIFLNTGRTIVWDTTNTQSATSTSKLVPLASGLIGYGRIPAAQDAFVGNYSDTVTATVNY